jgi:hypothetical protein
MTWSSDRRLDFIDWCLAIRGEVQRADISGVFGVSTPQASIDIAAFERVHPGAMRYDKTAKRYVPSKTPYESRRGMDDPNVRRALSLLSTAGHPMGWAGESV